MPSALAGVLAAAAALAAGTAGADSIPVPPEPAPAQVLLEPERPHATGGILYWRDHRLAPLCGEVGGTFLKLASSSAHACIGGTLGPRVWREPGA